MPATKGRGDVVVRWGGQGVPEAGSSPKESQEWVNSPKELPDLGNSPKELPESSPDSVRVLTGLSESTSSVWAISEVPTWRIGEEEKGDGEVRFLKEGDGEKRRGEVTLPSINFDLPSIQALLYVMVSFFFFFFFFFLHSNLVPSINIAPRASFTVVETELVKFSKMADSEVVLPVKRNNKKKEGVEGREGPGGVYYY